MKKLLLAGALCAFAPLSHADSKPAWRNDYNTALQEAKRLKKPLFIDFYTDWCGPCQYMNRTTFRDLTFLRESRKWVMLKINPEKNAANERIALKYQVAGFPTIIFADTSGNVLDSINGFSSAPWQKWLQPKMKNAWDKFKK